MARRFVFLALIALAIATPSSPFHPYIAARKLAKRAGTHTSLRPSRLPAGFVRHNETLLREQILPNTTTAKVGRKKKEHAYANGHTFIPNLPGTTWKHGAWETHSNHTSDDAGKKHANPQVQAVKKTNNGERPGHGESRQTHWRREDVDSDRSGEEDVVDRPWLSTGHSVHGVRAVSPFSKGVLLFLFVVAAFIGRMLLRTYAKTGAKKARALRKRLNPAAMA